MKHKYEILFYSIETVWCAWLVIWIYGELQKNPSWFTWSGFGASVLLLIWWVWTLYKLIKKSRAKELDYILEKEDGKWWLTINKTKVTTPFNTRPEAFDLKHLKSSKNTSPRK